MWVSNEVPDCVKEAFKDIKSALIKHMHKGIKVIAKIGETDEYCPYEYVEIAFNVDGREWTTDNGQTYKVWKVTKEEKLESLRKQIAIDEQRIMKAREEIDKMCL